MTSTSSIEQIQSVVVKRLRTYNDDSDLEYSQIFYNRHTLRLRTRGKNLMCKHYQFWKLDPLERTSGNIIALLRKMQYPYFLNSRCLILFNEQDAFMARLAGAQGWLDGK
jgi:hypothetical protein